MDDQPKRARPHDPQQTPYEGNRRTGGKRDQAGSRCCNETRDHGVDRLALRLTALRTNGEQRTEAGRAGGVSTSRASV